MKSYRLLLQLLEEYLAHQPKGFAMDFTCRRLSQTGANISGIVRIAVSNCQGATTVDMEVLHGRKELFSY